MLSLFKFIELFTARVVLVLGQLVAKVVVALEVEVVVWVICSRWVNLMYKFMELTRKLR